MMLCGLRVIVAPMGKVPENLRFGKNVIVVTARECVELAADAYEPKVGGPVLSLLKQHGEYLKNI